jgi:hypothetical protein
MHAFPGVSCSIFPGRRKPVENFGQKRGKLEKMELQIVKDADGVDTVLLTWSSVDAQMTFEIAEPLACSVTEYERLSSGEPCHLAFEEHNGGTHISISAGGMTNFQVSRHDGGGSLVFSVPSGACARAFCDLLEWRKGKN